MYRILYIFTDFQVSEKLQRRPEFSRNIATGDVINIMLLTFIVTLYHNTMEVKITINFYTKTIIYDVISIMKFEEHPNSIVLLP